MWGEEELYVCLLLNWLCVIVRRYEPKSPQGISEKIKAVVKHMKIDGGRVLMAITNTPMIVQLRSSTVVCMVRSRESNHGQG